MKRRAVMALMLAAPSALASACGYKRVETGATISKKFKTIAIPTFRNPSLRFKVEQRFTDAITRELLKRDRHLTIVTNPETADLVLTGEIKDLRSGGALLDDTGRTRLFEVVVVTGVTLRDRVHEKVLFDNQRMTFRGEYEIASDPASFFDEEDPALDRMAREFAQSVVSTIFEGDM
ncbi:MAG TPA: LptE family protein [Blastocatellia bacterium]|nr:LptE family protein [Blastocatellia bacterium]